MPESSYYFVILQSFPKTFNGLIGYDFVRQYAILIKITECKASSFRVTQVIMTLYTCNLKLNLINYRLHIISWWLWCLNFSQDCVAVSQDIVNRGNDTYLL